jgi:hypothetical protein
MGISPIKVKTRKTWEKFWLVNGGSNYDYLKVRKSAWNLQVENFTRKSTNSDSHETRVAGCGTRGTLNSKVAEQKSNQNKSLNFRRRILRVQVQAHAVSLPSNFFQHYDLDETWCAAVPNCERLKSKVSAKVNVRDPSNHVLGLVMSSETATLKMVLGCCSNNFWSSITIYLKLERQVYRCIVVLIPKFQTNRNAGTKVGTLGKKSNLHVEPKISSKSCNSPILSKHVFWTSAHVSGSILEFQLFSRFFNFYHLFHFQSWTSHAPPSKLIAYIQVHFSAPFSFQNFFKFHIFVLVDNFCQNENCWGVSPSKSKLENWKVLVGRRRE